MFISFMRLIAKRLNISLNTAIFGSILLIGNNL